MKKIKKIETLLFFLALLMLVGLIYINRLPSNIGASEMELSFGGGYPRIIYLGFKECPWCIEAFPVAVKAANTLGVDISYFDTQKKENINYYQQLKKYLCKQLNLNYILVPLVITVGQNGKINDFHLGTIEGHNAVLTKMSKEQKKLLEEIYQEMFFDWKKECYEQEKM